MNIPIEKSIDLQKLYELWLKKSEWSLLDEAIPLLYGHAPTGPGESANQKPDKSMQLLLEKSVREGTLRLESGEEELSGARVKPEHIYSWAVKQKIAIPPEFSALMDFILKTVINESLEEELPERDASESSLSGNEKVLGACLALLAKYGDDCRGKSGKVSLEKLLRLMDKEREKLFRGNEPQLSSVLIRDVVSQWLQKLN